MSTSSHTADLDLLRSRIRDLDHQILDLAANRLEIARQIGRLKTKQGKPIKDIESEKVAIENARAAAKHLSIPEGFAEELERLLIEQSLAVQSSIE